MKYLLLALISLPALAGEARLPQAGEINVAVTSMSLYEATPDPSFGTKAAQIGRIQKNDQVRVLETRQYPSTVFGTEVWVEVVKESEPTVHGWILAGVAGGQSKLAPVKTEENKPNESDELVSSFYQD